MAYQKNELLEVEITDIGNEGEGIGKCDGYTLFVKDAVIGDLVQARITKPKKNYAYARVEKVLTPSPFRVDAPCPIHRQCGGCQIQAMSYEKQLEYKQNKVRGNLIRLGGFSEELVDSVMEPIVGMENCFRYRNKAQYPIGLDKAGNPVAGFYAGRTHRIIANTDCLLGDEGNQEILQAVLSYMKEQRVVAYDEITGKGVLRHVLIRNGRASGEILVCLVINARELPAKQALLDKLTVIKNMTSVSYSINMEKTNVIMGTEIVNLWGTSYITDRIRIYKPGLAEFDGREVAFRISALSFYQVNPKQTEKLYSLALEYAGLTGNETVWDLYCGIGTISLFLAGDAKKVYGVEIIPQAIADAKENARLNGITNAEFFVGKAEEVLPKFYRGEMCDRTDANCEQNDDAGVSVLDGMVTGAADDTDMRHPNVIVVDPPRKGCDEVCLQTMLQMAPERIVYVSCDSATLARDLRILCDGGYELQRVRPVDQFGQTVHVETVVLLSQQHADDYINIELDLEEFDLTSAESKASYREIKEYIFKKYGTKVSTLYIAQIKRKCGIELGINYNPSKKENARVPICPPEKEKMILDALKHFQMI